MTVLRDRPVLRRCDCCCCCSFQEGITGNELGPGGGIFFERETLLNICMYFFRTINTALYYIDVRIGTSLLFKAYLERRLKALALVSHGSKER